MAVEVVVPRIAAVAAAEEAAESAAASAALATSEADRAVAAASVAAGRIIGAGNGPPDPEAGEAGSWYVDADEPSLWGPKTSGGWSFDRYGLTLLTDTPAPRIDAMIGAWNAEDYDSTPVRLIPNSAQGVGAPSENLIPAPRCAYGDAAYFQQAGATVTDFFAAGPDGQTTASRVQLSGGSGIAFPNTTYGSQYSGRIWLKSNTGSPQTIYIFGPFGSGASVNVTTAWQAFSRANFDPSGTGDLYAFYIPSGSADILVEKSELYASATNPGTPHAFAGHMQLGVKIADTTPPVSAGEVDITTSAYATVQFNNASNLTAFTVSSLVRVVNLTGSNHSLFRDFAQVNNLYLSAQELRAVGFRFGGSIMTPQDDQENGAYNLLNTPGYHVITHRYDGTYLDVFVDNWPLYRQTAAITAQQIRDLKVFGNFCSGVKFNAARMWDIALTDGQVVQAVAYLQTRVGLAVSPAPLDRATIAGGDSISSYPGQFPYWAQETGGGLLSPASQISVIAHPASQLGTPASQDDSIWGRWNRYGARIAASRKVGQKAIYTIYNSNDIFSSYSSFGGSRSAWLAALFAHAQAARDAGCIVGLCTILPRSPVVSPNFNTERNIANPLIRAQVGISCDFIVDFAADGTMGPDGAASNPVLFPDGVHPDGSASGAAQTYLTPIWATALNAQ